MKYLTYKLFFPLFIATGICFSIFTSCEKEKDPIFSANKINEPIGSIVYTDVNPDSVIRVILNKYNYYDLDLNNDGVNDFKFGVYTKTKRCNEECGLGRYFSTSAGKSNGSLNQIEINGLYPASLDSLAKIDVNTTWSTPTSLSILRSADNCCKFTNYKGNWDAHGVFKYLGLKLIVGSKTYYGWIRLKVFANGPGTSVIINDFAYNRISNQQIRAGQRY